ncbi:aquaporin-like protein [Melampsora americana]|nr:aquaporin-like protein [Melampsora americana]
MSSNKTQPDYASSETLQVPKESRHQSFNGFSNHIEHPNSQSPQYIMDLLTRRTSAVERTEELFRKSFHQSTPRKGKSFSEATCYHVQHHHAPPIKNPDTINSDIDGVGENSWHYSLKLSTREYAAEFLGTCVMMIFGNGVSNQVILNSSPLVSSAEKGNYHSITLGWGIGVFCGVYVAGGISGAHLNPAVTISLAVFRGFSWKKVIPYWVSQILGAFVGSVIIQAVYYNAINLYEGGISIRTVSTTTSTAALFFPEPATYMSAVNDRQNTPPPQGTNPFVLLWVVIGLGTSLGSQTAYVTNPARDFGPRLMATIFGYGSEVWSLRHMYWLWVPWLATCSGALFGSFVYDLLLYTGRDSPLNRLRKPRIHSSTNDSKDIETGLASSNPTENSSHSTELRHRTCFF